jgi:glycosyltransferase involved in cell wall biosynthesis
MIIYSIIIPHKNIPELLKRCLDSIPRRKDAQIIVVDDNSDINIVDFSNFPGLNDPYVEVIFGKNENGRKGAGYARNLGLKKAKGKWLIFADADDYFMPCLNEVLDKYENNENDIIFFQLTSIDNTSSILAQRHLSFNNRLKYIEETNDWSIIYNLHFPWGKLIKRAIITDNNITFREVQYGNDVYFGIRIIAASEFKIIAKEELYCIISREGSLITQISAESLITRFNEIYRAVIFLKNEGKINNLEKGMQKYWLNLISVNTFQAFLLIPKMLRIFKTIQVMKILYHFVKSKTINE